MNNRALKLIFHEIHHAVQEPAGTVEEAGVDPEELVLGVSIPVASENAEPGLLREENRGGPPVST